MAEEIGGEEWLLTAPWAQAELDELFWAEKLWLICSGEAEVSPVDPSRAVLLPVRVFAHLLPYALATHWVREKVRRKDWEDQRTRSFSCFYLQCTEAKKHCWYFEGLYPTYYICRSYEDCCGSRCCVRALSIQRLWYFWFLLMMGVLFCCGAGFFIRRRMYPPPLIEEPAFNVSYTRQPPNPGPGAQQPGPPYYTDPGGPGMNPVGNSMAMAFQVPPNSPQGSVACPPPPAYCNTPPPPYEQVVKAK
uniref:WW domain binding protein VOPP1 n=1 Tax=Saimiri boliviensis boliviensis TaxID=39432 RepID=A0A2K6TSI9_SAIBB